MCHQLPENGSLRHRTANPQGSSAGPYSSLDRGRLLPRRAVSSASAPGHACTRSTSYVGGGTISTGRCSGAGEGRDPPEAPEYGPADEPWGVRRFYCRDPFGKLVNILVACLRPVALGRPGQPSSGSGIASCFVRRRRPSARSRRSDQVVDGSQRGVCRAFLDLRPFRE